MQSNSSSEAEDKEIIIQLYRVTILLEPITEALWYEMKREQINLPELSEVNRRSCSFCLDEFEPASTYVKCLDCEQFEVLICLECFRLGTESAPHSRGHRYVLCDSIGAVFFDDEQNSWGAQEDLQLLNSLLHAHLNQWPELSKDWGHKRTLNEALERLDTNFIRSEIGQHVLKKYKRGFVTEWGEQSDGERNQIMPMPSSSNGIATATGTVKCNGLAMGIAWNKASTEEDGEDFSGNERDKMEEPGQNSAGSSSSNSSPISKRRPYFDEEENSEGDFSENGEIRMAMRSAMDRADEHPGSSAAVDNRKIRKEQLLAAAKDKAAEALRTKGRKTSLELSEAINLEGARAAGQKKAERSKKNKVVSDSAPPEQLLELFTASGFNPHFYNVRPRPMDSQTVSKFDEEDLQLLSYLPFRGEFENEYKNDAEKLISRILFPSEDAELSEVDELLNEVRYARFNRYNRLMRTRAAKKAQILEHNLLAEYLGIVKTNISEKGKYSVFFGERYFSSKGKEDSFRPVFSQLRQVAGKESVKQLAKDVAAMETLKDQIDELRELQKKGVTRLKGRLKIDSSPVIWSRKRKNKKTKENAEQRKAGLRWKRIKRWTKRNHLQGGTEARDE